MVKITMSEPMRGEGSTYWSRKTVGCKNNGNS